MYIVPFVTSKFEAKSERQLVIITNNQKEELGIGIICWLVMQYTTSQVDRLYFIRW